MMDQVISSTLENDQDTFLREYRNTVDEKGKYHYLYMLYLLLVREVKEVAETKEEGEQLNENIAYLSEWIQSELPQYQLDVYNIKPQIDEILKNSEQLLVIVI